MISQTVVSPSVKDQQQDILLPILVAGGGRTGTTLLMQLLGTDNSCIFDHTYPLEGNYLSYLIFFLELFNGRDMLQMADRPGGFHPDLRQFPLFQPGRNESSYLMPLPEMKTLFWQLWREFCKSVRSQRPDARFYAEKCSVWVSCILQELCPTVTIYSIRDPRDTFLSTNAWGAKNKAHGFGRTALDTDGDHALKIAASYLNSLLNYQAGSGTGTSFAVRYEDLVADPLSALEPVSLATGLQIKPANLDRFYDSHRTTKSKDASIARWQKEPMSADLQELFEINFAPELSFFNYATSARFDQSALVQFSGAADAAQIGEIQGATVLEVNSHGLEFSMAESKATLHIKPKMSLTDTDEIWIAVAGDFCDSYELQWKDDSGKLSEPLIEIRVPGDQYRIIRFALGLKGKSGATISEVQLTFNRSGETSNLSSNGCLKWVRRISIPSHRNHNATTAATDRVAFSDREVTLQQAAHIELLTLEFNRLNSLVEQLQGHISHVENERDAYGARWNKLKKIFWFLP